MSRVLMAPPKPLRKRAVPPFETPSKSKISPSSWARFIADQTRRFTEPLSRTAVSLVHIK
jgi:hypothetical protein